MNFVYSELRSVINCFSLASQGNKNGIASLAIPVIASCTIGLRGESRSTLALKAIVALCICGAKYQKEPSSSQSRLLFVIPLLVFVKYFYSSPKERLLNLTILVASGVFHLLPIIRFATRATRVSREEVEALLQHKQSLDQNKNGVFKQSGNSAQAASKIKFGRKK